jgi:hypothetical protein
MNQQKEILKELRRIRAGRIVDDTVAICHDGKPCPERVIITFKKHTIVVCKTLIPCRTATNHNLTIYGEF